MCEVTPNIGVTLHSKKSKKIGNMANLKVLLCLLKQKYLTLTANKIWLKSNQYIRYKHKNNVKTVETDPG